jgi:hypothetical protein
MVYATVFVDIITKKIISGYLIVVEVLFVVYHLLEADLNLKLKAGCLSK